MSSKEANLRNSSLFTSKMAQIELQANEKRRYFTSKYGLKFQGINLKRELGTKAYFRSLTSVIYPHWKIQKQNVADAKIHDHEPIYKHLQTKIKVRQRGMESNWERRRQCWERMTGDRTIDEGQETGEGSKEWGATQVSRAAGGHYEEGVGIKSTLWIEIQAKESSIKEQGGGANSGSK